MASLATGIALVLVGFLFGSLSAGGGLLPAFSTTNVVLTVVLLLLPLAPVTHVAGILRVPGYRFWQPFLGGVRFVMLQALAWTLFGLAALTAGRALLHWASGHVPPAALAAVSAISAVLAQLAMVSALSRYDGSQGSISKPISVGVVLVLVSLAMSLSWGSLSGFPRAELLWSAMASACVLVAVPLTHGLEGRYRYRCWSFYQPLRGGTLFIALQAAGWSLFGLALVLAGWAVWLGRERGASGLLVSSSLLGVVSEVLIVFSISAYDAGPQLGPATRAEVLRRYREENSVVYSSERATHAAIRGLLEFAAAVLTTNSQLLFPGTLLLIAMLFEGWHAVLVTAAVAVLYAPTYRNSPEVTGARTWPALVRWTYLYDLLANYHNVSVVVSERLDPGRQYVMGFHPHGVFPLTCMWLTRTSAFKALVPGVEPVPLGSSSLFWPPCLRDFAMYFGGRSVARESFELALSQGHSVILVPGGTAEMRAWSPAPDVTVVTHHHGFIRMAIRAGASLVPVFSPAENSVMSNIRMPAVQRFFNRLIGFPYPFFPMGRWYLPIPVRTESLPVLIGRPIHTKKRDRPAKEMVDAIAAKYFAEIERLFRDHKDKAGLAEWRLKFEHRKN